MEFSTCILMGASFPLEIIKLCHLLSYTPQTDSKCRNKIVLKTVEFEFIGSCLNNFVVNVTTLFVIQHLYCQSTKR